MMLRLILKKLTFKEENRIAGGKIRKKKPARSLLAGFLIL